jgi:hypothetical protein
MAPAAAFFQIGKVPTAGLNRRCVLAPFESVAWATEGKMGWTPSAPVEPAGRMLGIFIEGGSHARDQDWP